MYTFQSQKNDPFLNSFSPPIFRDLTFNVRSFNGNDNDGRFVDIDKYIHLRSDRVWIFSISFTNF